MGDALQLGGDLLQGFESCLGQNAPRLAPILGASVGLNDPSGRIAVDHPVHAPTDLETAPAFGQPR
jgi:hypothetical protein